MIGRSVAMARKSPKMIAAGKKAAHTRKWRAAAAKSEQTATWATNMTKWLIAKTDVGVKWQLGTFTGPGGRESQGIVDILAIRKDHRTRTEKLKRGDLFEILLIQVKGGKAPWPTISDIHRLREVAKHHRAKRIVLATWKKGKQPTFYQLRKILRKDFGSKDAWIESRPGELFS